MAEVMASAATGVLGTVIGKLATMLTDKYQLAQKVKTGIRFLRDELITMDAVLQMLAEKDDDQMDPRAKDWRNKVREMSYDIEDCIDRFMLNHSHTSSKASFVHKKMEKLKRWFKDEEIGEEIRELKSLVNEQSERVKRYYDINQCLLASQQAEVVLDPRALTLYQEATDLVGIDAPREEITQLLKCEDKDHKVVSIYGIGGQGKTTLAMDVYHKITEALDFDCRAFVFVSQIPDIKKILRDILSQISKGEFSQYERFETEQLIRTVRECLKDKRYFIVIDDIWKQNAWYDVRSALPLNHNGSRIITTTRNKDVANSCCTGIAAQMYEAKKLSDEDSQRLFFKRLFCSAENCPPNLREISCHILRKCDGLPLAIISMAGLLANKSKRVEDWVDIAAAVDKDSPIDKMKRILLLSYFDLPHHLKSCLLYLSVFPEDDLIDCGQLILLWVAEGLILGQDRECMEQRGRNYLIELINRSLVQPNKVDGTIMINCRVHDVILEFIVSKAVEDNFVTIWNGNGFSKNYYSNKIRRLSIQKDISGGAAEEMAKTMKNADHIRSISIFGDHSLLVDKHAYQFLCCQVLRVLNVGGVFPECSLGHVRSFCQLKYLRAGLKLLEDTEKLQHLETLDVTQNSRLQNLPTCIIHLHKLVRLFVSEWVRLPDGIGNLQALEELSRIDLDIQSVKFIQGLGDLINLRVLRIIWSYSTDKLTDTECHKKECISSLSKLFTRLRELHMLEWFNSDSIPLLKTLGVRVPALRDLVVGEGTRNFRDPQINSLGNLTRLYINVYGEAGMEGISILATLPTLLSLSLYLRNENDQDGASGTLYPRYAINAQGFQLLVKFILFCHREAALEFQRGAMPKIEKLKLQLMARCQFKYGESGLVLGLQNLASLKRVVVAVDCDAAVVDDEVEALEDDIRGVAGAHPNRPMLEVIRFQQDLMAQGCSRRPSDHPML